MKSREILERIQRKLNREKLLSLLTALVLTTLLFLLLPVMYLFSRNQTGRLLGIRDDKRKLRTVELHKPRPKKREQLEKKVIKRVTKQEQPARNRFKLDLSMAMGTGEGVGVAAGRRLILRASEVDTPPVQKRAFAPTYPEQARREGIEASVTVDLLIDTDGNVREVLIKKCPPNWGFERAVRDTLLRWQFSPAKNNNIPVKVWATITIDFRL